MDKQITSPAIKGLIISLALIVLSVIVFITKQDTNRALNFIPIVVLFGGVVWACFSYSKQMDGNVTFGNIFSHGFKTSALAAGIMALWVALALTFLFPETLDRAMELQRDAMEKKGDLTDDQIEKYMVMGKKMAVPMGTIVTAILYLIIGAISALLGASIAKKNPNPTPFNN